MIMRKKHDELSKTKPIKDEEKKILNELGIK